MAIKFTVLTRPNIRQLNPGAKLNEHGISFERLLNGDGKYSINVMVDGQRIHRVVGKESDGVSREQAERVLEQLRTEARQERLNLPKNRKFAISFKEAAEDYLKRLEDEAGSDLVAKKQKLSQYLVPYFGTMPLVKISSSEIERYKKKRLAEYSLHGGDKSGNTNEQRGATSKPVTHGTINRELAVLSHLLNKAVEWKWIDSKPTQVKLLKLENTRITYLTPEQMDRLLEASRVDQSKHIYLFITIGLETSMRKMEILSIRLEHINLEQKVIFVPVAKTGAREQPITPHLAEILKQYIGGRSPDQKWLFPSALAASGHVISIEKAFRRVVIAAGLNPKEVLRHTLRHTAITHLVQAGVDLPTVQRISGHKTLQMVVRYSHQNGDHIQEAMGKLGQRYRPEEDSK